MNMKITWALLLLLGCPAAFTQQPALELISEWASIDFNFPSAQLRQEALTSRAFVPGMPVLMDVDVHYKAFGTPSRVFMTFPRFRDGIPITLGTRSQFRDRNGSQLIEPYPDYSWHQNPTQDCANKMVSVWRIAIDACERLWVVDSGKIGLPASPQVCPPKILVFDLNSNQLVHRYFIPESQYRANPNTLYVNTVLDVADPPPGNCYFLKAYIADVGGFSLLVYDTTTDSSWRTQSRLMAPSPQFSTHTISGESFFLADGIVGLAVEKGFGPNRSLFFHALASDQENSVPLSVLHDSFAWQANPQSYSNAFQSLGSRGTQSAASAIDSNGNLFFGLNSQNTLACWNIYNQPYSQATIKAIVRDDERLQFASGMKIMRNAFGEEELWIVTNRFQKVSTGTMNVNEINFRIQARRVSELLNGNNCI